MKTLLLSAAIIASAAAAHSATFVYDMQLGYNGLTYKSAKVVKETADNEEATVIHNGDMRAEDNQWRLKTQLQQYEIGTSINLRVIAELSEDVATVDEVYYGNMTLCQIGAMTCAVAGSTGGGAVLDPYKLHFTWFDNAELQGGTKVGDLVSYMFVENYTGTYGQYYDADEAAYYYTSYDHVVMNFTILDVNEFPEIAPVPLPASAALLIAGLGGLAAMRRRRT